MMLYTAIVLVCMGGAGDGCQYYQKKNIVTKARCEQQVSEIVETFKAHGAEVARGVCIRDSVDAKL